MKKIIFFIIIFIGVIYLDPHLDISFGSDEALQKEVSYFASESISSGFINQSAEELVRRHISQDEENLEGMEYLLTTLNYKLGKLSTCDDIQVDYYTRWQLSGIDEFWNYEGDCIFSKGPASLDMDFKKINDQWYIYRFTFNSDLLE